MNPPYKMNVARIANVAAEYAARHIPAEIRCLAALFQSTTPVAAITADMTISPGNRTAKKNLGKAKPAEYQRERWKPEQTMIGLKLTF